MRFRHRLHRLVLALLLVVIVLLPASAASADPLYCVQVNGNPIMCV